MKKIICALLVLSTILLTSCQINIGKTTIRKIYNNPKIIQPSKSDNHLKLIESDKSDFEYITTLTRDDITALIPHEYYDYDYIYGLCMEDGLLYIETIKIPDDKYTQDIFCYDLDNDTMTHIADISKLNSRLIKVFKVNEKFYFHVRINKLNDDEDRLYLYDNNKLTLLTDDFYGPIRTEKGIAVSNTTDWSIVKFEGKNKTIINTKKFPSRIYDYNPLTYLSLMDGHVWLSRLDNNNILNTLELSSSPVGVFDDFFWVYESTNSENILSAYNYDNEELITFKVDKQGIRFSGNTISTNDILFYIDEDDDVLLFKYDKENHTIIKSKIENIRQRYAYFLTDKDYFISVYAESYDDYNYEYEIYRKK